MKQLLIILLSIFFLMGCSKEPTVMFDSLPQTQLQESSYSNLPNWESENYDEVLYSFMNNCRAKKSSNIYNTLCSSSQNIKDAKEFLESNFTPYIIESLDETKKS
ncbi:MAG: transglycosylase, partial [Sulfurimonas sp.]|nr:transglycosylase [Sulfurimonas sp.]